MRLIVVEMNTTIELSDSDDSDQIVAPKTVPKKIVKGSGKKLDDTIELISSDDDDGDEVTGSTRNVIVRVFLKFKAVERDFSCH